MASLVSARTALDNADYDTASQLLSQALFENPQDAEVVWLVGCLLGLNKRYKEAAQAFKQAVQLDPQRSEVVFAVGNHTINLQDNPGSTSAAMLVEEIGTDMYGLQNMQFNAGDVVLDIGAHIGGVSIVLGKLYPHIKIFAYEPSTPNYAALMKNLARNNLSNVTPVKKAVAGDAGTMELMWSPKNTAASGGQMHPEVKDVLTQHGWVREQVECVTLDEVLNAHSISRCAWLKLDCEGSEYGIFRNSGALEKVEKVSLELHIPISKQAMGEEGAKQEFLNMLASMKTRPEVNIASVVWMTGI